MACAVSIQAPGFNFRSRAGRGLNSHFQDMKPLVMLLALAVLISGCAVRPALTENIAQLLVGRWSQDDLISAEYVSHFEKQYFPNGTAEGFMDLYHKKSDGSRVAYVRRITFTSKWRVEGAVIVIWDMVSEPSGFLNPAEVDRDIVLKIDGKRIRYRTDDGELGENQRMESKPTQTSAANGSHEK